jgi:hypothetical protein
MDTIKLSQDIIPLLPHSMLTSLYPTTRETAQKGILPSGISGMISPAADKILLVVVWSFGSCHKVSTLTFNNALST